MRRALAGLAAFALLLAACTGAVGTIELELVTPPGSDVMDEVQTLRITLTDPETVFEAERQGDRFDLSIEVDADGQNGFILVEGLDSDGNLVASGASGPLPIAAIDASVRIFVAPPVSLEQAPVSLSSPRSELGSTRLSFGVLMAGGRDAGGAPSAEVELYNLYDHRIQAGAPLPEARAGLSVMTASAGQVLMFGGENDGGEPTATLWRFDTNAAPAGSYTTGAADDALARSHAVSAPAGDDLFIVLGDPVVLVNGFTNDAEVLDVPDPLDGTAVSVNISGSASTLVAGEGAGVTGATLIFNLSAQSLDQAIPQVARTGHGAALVPGGRVIVAGGATGTGLQASGVLFDFLTLEFARVDDMLATPRRDAAVAAAGDYVVVAGGTDTDGEVVGDAEVFTSDDMAPVATLPMVVPRTGATALRMQNNQILIAGGLDANGEPTDVIELFTP